MIAVRSLSTARRAAALLAVAFAMALPAPQPSAPDAGVAAREEVAYMHEARLRKLHLVRPDLISYPISFDAVC
jgi:hypothetical protein